MNFDKKPRLSVTDTLRAALPMRWLAPLSILGWMFYVVISFPRNQITAVLQDWFGLSRDIAETVHLFLLISASCAASFFAYFTLPYHLEQKRQKQREREYSRRQKVAAEHQEILERWKREVQPEGETK